jgi:hypothetical protein
MNKKKKLTIQQATAELQQSFSEKLEIEDLIE